MKYKIRINPIAITDVEEIKAYIAQDNPAAADRMGAAILSRVEKLADFPRMGASLGPKIGIKTDYRFLGCGRYLIFYKIEGEFISIYRILHGMRDYLSILFTEEMEEE